MAKLVKVCRGEINRLMVFMPPGSAKSTYSSVLFPPWYLRRHKDHSVLGASHPTEPAEKWGRNSRSKSLKIIRPLDGGRSSRVVNTTQLVSELASLGSVLISPSSTTLSEAERMRILRWFVKKSGTGKK